MPDQGGHYVEPARAGVRGDQVQHQAEKDDESRFRDAPQAHLPTPEAVRSRGSPVAPPRPSPPDVPPRTESLCARASGASSLTSSGPTKSRARVAARAWATLTSAMEPRGETPRETAGWLRVASASATA